MQTPNDHLLNLRDPISNRAQVIIQLDRHNALCLIRSLAIIECNYIGVYNKLEVIVATHDWISNEINLNYYVSGEKKKKFEDAVTKSETEKREQIAREPAMGGEAWVRQWNSVIEVVRGKYPFVPAKLNETKTEEVI